MGIFTFILLCVLFVLFLALCFAGDFDCFMGGLMALAVLFFVGIVIPYSMHNSALATIDNSERIVKIQEEYRDKLSERLNSIPKTDLTIMNSDSPISSIVSEIASSEMKIAEANQDILEAEMSIEKRERGLTSYILWFF